MTRLDIPKKVLDIVSGRGFVAPDAYDDLPAIIRWSTDLMRDPWCPHVWHDDLRRMLHDATGMLAYVRSGGGSGAG